MPPKFYGLPKIHKVNIPLRPIVSSIDSITYSSAKFLAEILSPLVGNSIHHVVNSLEFSKLMKNKRVEEDEELRSYDVTALFTSVPVDKSLEIIHTRLQNDPTLNNRTTVTPQQIIKLLKVCLRCTYFVYNGTFYQQIRGAAMGSPVSPIVCNLYMENMEQLAIKTALHPPIWWYRYVDDTHTKLKKAHAQEFTDHLNSLDPDIKFTTEGEVNRSLAFLDTLTVIQNGGSINIKIYRKPTHTDQYLNFNSNHPLQHKLGVINTLYYRANSLVTKEEDKIHECLHIDQALNRCGYPNWAINRATRRHKGKVDYQRHKTTNKGLAVIPYIKGVSETLKRTFETFDITTCFKPTCTLRQLLVSPKDKSQKKDITGAIYHIPCQGKTTSGKCKDSYIGESERTLKTRFLEHQ
ncbi:uncharacterized protein LOC117110160 [Anneissia japonica]|uniref:uncharacterized protein LOC117110160 n=1 Tax=Anneissia japonica TaxID=1529436 RepID=UPI00142585E4|nr:uncharacterized protein LOC117110160 [Anneissia japonica]